MLKNIDNKNVGIFMRDEKIKLPQDIQDEINENWRKIEAEGSNVWNGEVYCVTKLEDTGKEVVIECKRSNYSHYLYGERIGLPKQYECKNISAGALIETSDHYYLVGELDTTTSYPHMLQVSGGNIDNADIKDGKANIIKTITREVMEEVNIDLEDKSIVSGFQTKYMYITEENEQPGIQIFAKANLNMTAEEVQEHYKRYLEYLKENNLEVEFGKIHFIHDIMELDRMPNPKRTYLKPLIEAGIREREEQLLER